MSLLKGNRSFLRLDDDGISFESGQPFFDMSRIGNGSTHEKELRILRGEGDGELVLETALPISDHLVFINDEKMGPLPGKESLSLGFERSYNYRRFKILGDIAGGDTDLPSLLFPFPPLIVGKCPGGHRVDGLPVSAKGFPILDEGFENKGLSRTCRSRNDDVLTGSQRSNCLLLPQVRNL